MNVSEFKQALRTNAPNSGGEFVRTDFHLHMPGAGDYEYNNPDCVEKMGAALRAGEYGAVVVLKHQEFPTRDELDSLQKHCPNTLLIPGAEINVFVNTMFKKVEKDHYYHCIVAADPQTEWGYLLHKAKESLDFRGTGYPSGYYRDIRDVAKLFTDSGALFIPAHLHQAKPPENSRSIDDIYDDGSFLEWVGDGLFSALEVRKANTAEFFKGNKKTSDGVPIPAAVCVQSSDAHHHDHVPQRNRSTWVQLENRSFSELRSALRFSHRVTIAEPKISHSRVIGMHIAGQFLKDVWLAFNSGINCLIGSKGSGKTSVLECLRFGLATHVPGDRADSVKKHIDHILGPAGYVECLVQRADGSEAVMVRRSDSPDRITVTEADGTSHDVDAGTSVGFDIAILGWHEIESVADHASARVELVDRVKSEDQIKAYRKTIREKISDASDLLPQLQSRIHSLHDEVKELWSLKRRRRSLDKLEKGSLFDLQDDYERFVTCEQEIKIFRKQLERAQRSATTYCKRASTISLTRTSDGPVPKEVQEAYESVARTIGAYASVAVSADSSLNSAFAIAIEQIDSEAARINSAFAKFRKEQYEPQVGMLSPEDREVLTRQIQIIEQTKSLPEVDSECQSRLSDIHSMASQMHAHCDAICKARAAIRTLREQSVKEINDEISEIELQFIQSADRTKRERFSKRYRQETGDLLGFVDSFGGGESYEKLRDLFAKLKSLNIDEDKYEVRSVLWDAKLVEFLEVYEDDDVAISLKVKEAGYVPIQNLSAGQRCTAVFPLLLRNQRGPLVIDQPEDNLDNRYIADVIAPDLLQKKRSQQFVATSHNANLVVLTDADLVVHVDSNGKDGKLERLGFFGGSDSPIRLSILDVLDGGEQALRARQQKYGA